MVTTSAEQATALARENLIEILPGLLIVVLDFLGTTETRMPNLICLRGPDQGQDWELPMIDIDMGRSPSNHVVVHDAKASRQHCKLIMGESTVKLQDLKSRNGTKVEGKSIDEMVLHYDQIFQVGDSLFIIS